jgi:hypothetical protein
MPGSSSNSHERTKAYHFVQQILQEELAVGAMLKIIDGDDEEESLMNQFWIDLTARGPVYSFMSEKKRICHLSLFSIFSQISSLDAAGIDEEECERFRYETKLYRIEGSKDRLDIVEVPSATVYSCTLLKNDSAYVLDQVTPRHSMTTPFISHLL